MSSVHLKKQLHPAKNEITMVSVILLHQHYSFLLFHSRFSAFSFKHNITRHLHSSC